MAVRIRGAASLFHVNPARPVTPIAVMVAVAFAALVSAVRAMGLGSWSSPAAAEDGFVLDEAFHTSVGASLLQPYDDASHLLPRLLAELAVHAPAGWEAGVFSIGAALLTAGLVLVVYTASAGLPRRLQRLLVSVPIVVLPLAEPSALGLMPVLRWQLVYAAFWAILWVSPSRAGRIIGPLIVGLAAFSNAIGWVLIPLMAIRLVGRRDASAVAAGVALFAGTAWQLAVAWATPGSRPKPEPGTIMTILDRIGPLELPVRWFTETAPVVIGLLTVAVIVIYAVAIYLASTVVDAGLEMEVPVGMLLVAALVALTNPTGDLLVPQGAGLRDVAPWLPVTGLAALLAVAWLVDLGAAELREPVSAGYSATGEASHDGRGGVEVAA